MVCPALKVTVPGMEVWLIFQVNVTRPMPPDAIDICALKTIFTVAPQAMTPKLLGFIEIAMPASCNGVLVTTGVGEDAGEAVACGVIVVLDVEGVGDPVPDGDGVLPHALTFKPTNVTSKSVSSKRLSIVNSQI